MIVKSFFYTSQNDEREDTSESERKELTVLNN